MISTSQPASTAASARRRTRGSKGYQSKVIIPTRIGDMVVQFFQNQTSLGYTTACANPLTAMFTSLEYQVYPELPGHEARSLEKCQVYHAGWMQQVECASNVAHQSGSKHKSYHQCGQRPHKQGEDQYKRAPAHH